MRNSQANQLREGIEDWATEQPPLDGFTTFASVANKIVGGILSWPTVIMMLVSTLVLGILSMLTFRIALLPFIGILWLLNIVTVGTSWLWLNVPISRILILLPGVIFAAVQSNYTALLPYFGDWDSRAEDLARAGVWPRSYLVQQLPQRRREALVEWEHLKEKFTQSGMTSEELISASLPVWNFLSLTAPDLAEIVQDEYSALVEDKKDSDDF